MVPSTVSMALLVGAAAGRRATNAENMNGEYMLAATPHGNTTWSTNFRDYPGGVESFDVYTEPITSTYGEVFWTPLPEVALPPEIVARFKGKGMAVVGFESDQVRKGAGPSGEDVSVPINVAYNHHYGATLLGAGSRMERVPYDPHCPHKANNCSRSLLTPTPGWDYIAVEHTPAKSGLPTSLWCGYSNGGEFRKSYHGIPPPFAQLIDSPKSFSLSPMQIDTWNRDAMSLSGGKFVPGPYPRKAGNSKWPSGSLAPVNGSDAVYSGLLECPLTTRIRKHLTGGGWNDSFAANIACAQTKESCPAKIETAEACFAAAKQVAISPSVQVTTAQGHSTTLPPGCSIQNDGSHAIAYFNSNSESPVCCGAGVETVTGSQKSLVSLDLTLSTSVPGTATITMSGPADVWFGVGFDTNVMANAPYTITVDGNHGGVTERVLGDHTAGIVLNSSITVISNTVSSGHRTVVMTRPLKGLTPQHHDFDVQKLSLEFIDAIGSTPSFSYHKSKSVGTITLWPKTPPPSQGGAASFFEKNIATDQMRNDWDGEVGYSVTPQQPLVLNALGRASGRIGLKGTATVNVWSVSSKKIVATAQVGPTTSTVYNDGYAYTNLTSPVTLRPGIVYYVTQTCHKGMPDKWSNSAANGPLSNPAMATLGNGVYSNQGQPGVFPTNSESTRQFAGIVNFMADLPPNPHPNPAAACICSIPAAPFGQGRGTIKYLTSGEEIGFPLRCDPFPRETVLRDRNPTCDIRTYAGGLSTCHHSWHLLDADQPIPWEDKKLTYRFKFRFYFQEYSPTQHVAAYGWNTGIGGDTAEYDVPQCAPGTPVEKCTHEISGLVTAPPGKMHFVGAHYHCHAPTCLRMEIYNNITGELLCAEEPYHGQGNDVGGGDRFDEAGYIAQRVCLWGNSTYGLEKPPAVGGVPLYIRAITNSTYGHHGEMALPQMLVADLP